MIARRRSRQPGVREQLRRLELRPREFIEEPEDRALTALLAFGAAVFVAFSFAPGFWVALVALVALLYRARQRRVAARRPLVASDPQENGRVAAGARALDHEATLAALLELVGSPVAVAVDPSGADPSAPSSARLCGRLGSASDERLGGHVGDEALFFAVGEEGSGFLISRRDFRAGERIGDGIDVQLAGWSLSVLEGERVP